MNWKGRRVLVTGAGGFIGSHLTEELARRGAKVRALVRYNSRGSWGFLEETPPELSRRVEVRRGDIADPHFVLELARSQDIVFHLAAMIAIPYSYQAPGDFVSANITGTLNILEACRRSGARRLLVTSTSEVYGTALYTPIDENHPLQGQSPYSASKIGADHLAESYYRSFGLPLVILRPFNTFGPRQSARAVIPTIICQLLEDPPRLRLGSLGPVRDFNFVDDTVAGFLAAAASPKAVGQVVNLGSGRGVSVKTAAETLMRLTGRRAELQVERRRLRPAKSEVHKLLCDNRKARRLLGWKPQVALEEGLVRTVEYIRTHRAHYKSSLYNI